MGKKRLKRIGGAAQIYIGMPLTITETDEEGITSGVRQASVTNIVRNSDGTFNVEVKVKRLGTRIGRQELYGEWFPDPDEPTQRDVSAAMWKVRSGRVLSEHEEDILRRAQPRAWDDVPKAL